MWHITNIERDVGIFYAIFFIILTNPKYIGDKWMDNL